MYVTLCWKYTILFLVLVLTHQQLADHPAPSAHYMLKNSAAAPTHENPAAAAAHPQFGNSAAACPSITVAEFNYGHLRTARPAAQPQLRAAATAESHGNIVAGH